MNDIPLWFLVLSLIFPRITLLIAYCSGQIPSNTIPFWGDFIMAVILPRVLVMIYIAGNLGVNSPWFWIHLVFMAATFLFNLIRFYFVQSKSR
jgi:hypothetical protein